MKLTDDIRILVALRDGLEVRKAYKEGYKWHAAQYLRCIEGDGICKAIGKASINRAEQDGLIEVASEHSYSSVYDGYDYRYRLTEAGAAAAKALDVTLERVLAAPKPRPPKPELTREQKDEAKRMRYAWMDLAFLARGGRFVKNDRGGWAFNSMDKPYVPPCRNSFDVTVDRNLPLFLHLTEEFVGVDGRPSLRINAAGAEIIAKRRPLTVPGL